MKICLWTISALFTLVSACGGKTLKVGDGPEGGGGGGAGGSSVVGPADGEDGGAPTSCGPSDCSAYSFKCSEGTPTDVQCVLDKSPQFATPMCTLVGLCESGAVATCSYTPPPPTCTGSGACSVSAGGGIPGGTVSVVVNPTGTPGAASVLDAYFNYGYSSDTETLGNCVYDANGADLTQDGETGVPAPNPGIVTVTAPGFKASVSPACDGTYAPDDSSETIAPGAVVSFAFTPQNSSEGGEYPSPLPSLPAPHFIGLAASDALAASSPSFSRASDLPVDWTVMGTPLVLEQVVVLMTQGTATLTCTFGASTHSGVIPADALLRFTAGTASYGVYSVQEGDVMNATDGPSLSFLVEMAAATPTGLAKGALTLQ
jgi:hypothetical protein